MLEACDPRRITVRLRNPLVEEQSVMRTTLLPSLLETAAKNINYREMNQRIFELRRVYQPIEGQELPAEPLYLTGLLTGRREAEGWNQAKNMVDFFDAKGIVENIFNAFHLEDVLFSSEKPEKYFHPGKACNIYLGDEPIGTIGELHPDVLEKFGIEQTVYCFEINFEHLVAHSRDIVSISAPSRFPDTIRDIAMLINNEIPFMKVRECVSSLRIKEIEDVSIFDLYQGDNIPAGQKSIAIRLRYRLHDRTLTDEEVSLLHERVINHLINEIKVTIR